ncbi:MAG: hypothetical protein LUI85_16040 [Bacteroides sp.]|nr:hypothetical protein [Bacteroides sp.]
MVNKMQTAPSTSSVHLYRNFRQLSEQLSMEEVFRRIKGGMYESVILVIRRERKAGHKEKADGAKKTLPAVTVSTDYNGRRTVENLTAYYPHLVLDFDGIPFSLAEQVRDKAAKLPYTLMAFVSPSGEGVKVICHTPGNPNGLTGEELITLHRSYFKALSQLYSLRLGWKVDVSGSDMGRLMILGSDRNAYCVEHWPTSPYEGDFPVYKPENQSPCETQEAKVTTPPEIDAAAMKAFLAAREELRKQGVVYEPHNHNNYLYKMARKLNTAGICQEVAEPIMLANYEDYSATELHQLVVSAYTNHKDEHGTKQAAPAKGKVSINEVETYLSTHYKFRYNTITTRLEKAESMESKHYAPLDDYGENSVYRDLCLQGLTIRKNHLESLLRSDFVPRFNPLVSYMENLPEWDGEVDYISQLAATVTVEGDQQKWERNFKKWFVAMVASWLETDTVNHVALILVGRQNAYKTTWITSLLPPELKSYLYSGPVDPGNKDHILNLSRCALINNEEMDALSGERLNRFKSMITQNATNERAAYGRNMEYHPRCASFAGSTNLTEIVCDSTGLRRWLVEMVESIISPREYPFHYTGIYSQALSLLKNGFRYWFNNEEVREINMDNEQFEMKTVEEEMIQMWFRIPGKYDSYITLTAAQVLQKISYLVHTPMNKNNVGKALKRIGFACHKVKGITCYHMIELSPADVEANKSLM